MFSTYNHVLLYLTCDVVITVFFGLFTLNGYNIPVKISQPKRCAFYRFRHMRVLFFFKMKKSEIKVEYEFMDLRHLSHPVHVSSAN